MTLSGVVNCTIKVLAADKSQAPAPTVRKPLYYPQKYFSKKLKKIPKLTGAVSIEAFESIDNTQIAQLPQEPRPNTIPREVPPPVPPLPSPELPPPPEELLKPSPQPLNPEEQPINIPGSVTIQRFEVQGSTIFTPKELDAVTKDFTGRPITFKELTEVRSAITKLYTAGCNTTDDKWKPLVSRLQSKTRPCYVNSGAYIPQQDFEDGGIVTINVIEGELEEKIKVSGIKRL
ncbi:MAG: POTRA domain-containing protein, partial [Cyanobacteria bacterium J06636_27]